MNNKREYDRNYSREHPKTPEQKRTANLKFRYGISVGEYDGLFQLQNGKCAVCGKEGKLLVDHDHTTGRVRGLLCHECNIVLGFLELINKNGREKQLRDYLADRSTT